MGTAAGRKRTPDSEQARERLCLSLDHVCAAMSLVFPLPAAMRHLWEAQQEIVRHYGWTKLKFTLDGRLVGDLAEAIALEHFDLEPCAKRTKGVDALVAGTTRTVQVKASGNGSGPTFSKGSGKADYLLFLRLDFAGGSAAVEYNGPEAPIRALLPEKWEFTGTVKLPVIRTLAALVPHTDQVRLKLAPDVCFRPTAAI